MAYEAEGVSSTSSAAGSDAGAGGGFSGGGRAGDEAQASAYEASQGVSYTDEDGNPAGYGTVSAAAAAAAAQNVAEEQLAIQSEKDTEMSAALGDSTTPDGQTGPQNVNYEGIGVSIPYGNVGIDAAAYPEGSLQRTQAEANALQAVAGREASLQVTGGEAAPDPNEPQAIAGAIDEAVNYEGNSPTSANVENMEADFLAQVNGTNPAISNVTGITPASYAQEISEVNALLGTSPGIAADISAENQTLSDQKAAAGAASAAAAAQQAQNIANEAASVTSDGLSLLSQGTDTGSAASTAGSSSGGGGGSLGSLVSSAGSYLWIIALVVVAVFVYLLWEGLSRKKSGSETT
jgi:hypothetical protein